MQNTFDNWHGTGQSLAHYGVQGMKWGVRRYVDKNGSLTAAGKERYNRSPEGLGYHPMKGKRGDVVQRSIGKTQIKLARKAEKLNEKAAKDLEKNAGIESKRYDKLINKAKKAVEAAEFGKKMQETYYNMAIRDQKYIRSGYHIVRNAIAAGLVTGPIGGAIAGVMRTNRSKKLMSKTAGDRNYLNEKIRKNRYLSRYM